jgi:hypothetical protein
VNSVWITVLSLSIPQSQRILLQLNSAFCPIQLNDGCLKEWIELVGKRKRFNGKRQVAVPARIPISGSGHRWLLLAVSGVMLVAFIAVIFSTLRFDSKAGPATLPQSGQIVARLPSFSELALMSSDELERQDIALLNLRVAEGLPDAESLDVEATLKELDRWANRVRLETDRNIYKYHQEPSDFNNSEAYFRMLLLVTVLQQDFGVHYNEARIKDVDFTKSQDLFIHGMIGSTNGGTCVSMPALYTAVARRLGYPVHLVNAKEHIFCRWDGRGERVNVEGTNQGMNSFDDKHYITWPHPISQDEIDRKLYLQSLSIAESFSAFLASRGHCLEDTGNIEDASVSYSLAVKHSPRNPTYRTFLRRLVKPKTMEDFPEILAQQEKLQRELLDPIGNWHQPPYPSGQLNSTASQPFSNGTDPFANNHVDPFSKNQSDPFAPLSYGVPGR